MSINEIRPSPTDAAHIALHLLVARDTEKRRSTTRYRLSGQTMQRVTGRAFLTHEFTAEFLNALFRLGYVAFDFDGGIALIEREAVSGWPKISSKRVDARLNKLEECNYGDVEDIRKLNEQYWDAKQQSASWAK